MKRINWRRGASSDLVFMATIILIVTAAVFIIDNYSAISNGLSGQLYADAASNSAAIAANSGWGSFDKKVSEAVVDDIEKFAKENLNDTKITIKTSYDKEPDVEIAGLVYELPTVQCVTNTKTKTYTGQTLRTDRGAKVALLFAERLGIVREAYSHTVEGVAKGLSSVHTQYVWGGNHDPGHTMYPKYADCSGFTYGVYSVFGYQLGCYTGTDATMGRVVTEAEALPGDIILFYEASGYPGHTGIYVGKNDAGVPYMVHSSGGSKNTIDNPGPGAVLAPVSSCIGGHYVKAEYRNMIDTNGRGADVYHPTTNEKMIWSLWSAGYTESSICAILANIERESGFNPVAIESMSNTTYEMQYAAQLTNGSISSYDFAHFTNVPVASSYKGWGLCQWTTYDRKVGLYNYLRSRGADFTDPAMQICYMVEEILSGYPGCSPSVLNSMSAVDAAWQFTKVFESPDLTNPDVKSAAERTNNNAGRYATLVKAAINKCSGNS